MTFNQLIQKALVLCTLLLFSGCSVDKVLSTLNIGQNSTTSDDYVAQQYSPPADQSYQPAQPASEGEIIPIQQPQKIQTNANLANLIEINFIKEISLKSELQKVLNAHGYKIVWGAKFDCRLRENLYVSGNNWQEVVTTVLKNINAKGVLYQNKVLQVIPRTHDIGFCGRHLRTAL